jgi:hypothetical protein
MALVAAGIVWVVAPGGVGQRGGQSGLAMWWTVSGWWLEGVASVLAVVVVVVVVMGGVDTITFWVCSGLPVKLAVGLGLFMWTVADSLNEP